MIRNTSLIKMSIPSKNFYRPVGLIFALCVFALQISWAQADLSITKAVNNASPNVGEEITFTISISNAGPQVATGVTIRDILPSGYTNVVNISNGGVVAGSGLTEVLWPNLTIPLGTNVVNLTITATVLRGGNYNNRAEIIASDLPDPDSDPSLSFDTDDGLDGTADLLDDDESNEVVVTPKRADLSLTKTVDNLNPRVGDEVTFTIRLRNDGPNRATSVAVRDVIPSGYGNIVNISNSGSTFGSNIIWSNITINPGQTINLTITATVLPTGEYFNRAEVIASAVDDPDSNPASSFDQDDFGDGISDDDETDFVEVRPLIADLSIEKTASNLTPNVGREVDFTVTVTNNGPLDASDIVVTDALSQGFIYVSDDSLGAYNPATGEWSIATLESGETATLTITVIVSLEQDYTNTAEITASGSYDPNTSNNSATITLDPEDIFFAEGFSPNNDGINDTFEIPGLGYLYPDFKLEIYSRWGNKVYDYANNGRTEPVWWDGFSNGNLTFNGSKQVPTGTYYYIIYFNKDNKEPISNWIYLNR